MNWSKETNGYKAIFIAGNEPFTQGPVDYHQACKRAIERGIVVNTIHCGSSAEGVQGKWQDAAHLACIERALLREQFRLQRLQTFVLHRFRDLALHRRRRRAGAAGIFERIGRCETDLAHQRHGGFEIGVAFAGKADNEIG